MKAWQYPVIITIMAMAATVSGCLCNEINSGGGSGELTNFTLANGTEISAFWPDLPAGADAEFHVVSDHPLNMLIMDGDNYTKYYAAEQGGPVNWSAYAIALNVTDGGLRFLAPYNGSYMFVLDNTRFAEGSGAGFAPATFTARYSYNWSHYPFGLRYYPG